MHHYDVNAYEWRSEPNIIISACLFLSIPPTPQAVWNGQQVPLLPQSCSAGSFSLWKARPGECISGSDTSIVLGIALSRVLFTSKYPGSVAFSPRLLLVCVESIPLPLLLQHYSCHRRLYKCTWMSVHFSKASKHSALLRLGISGYLLHVYCE